MYLNHTVRSCFGVGMHLLIVLCTLIMPLLVAACQASNDCAGSEGPGALGQGPRPSGPHPEANKWLLAPFLPVDVRLVGGGMLALGLVYW